MNEDNAQPLQGRHRLLVGDRRGSEEVLLERLHQCRGLFRLLLRIFFLRLFRLLLRGLFRLLYSLPHGEGRGRACLGSPYVINVENAQPRRHGVGIKPSPVLKVSVEAEGRETTFELRFLCLEVLAAHLAPQHLLVAVGNLGAGLADDRRAHHRVKNHGGAWHRMVRTNVLNVVEHN